MMGFTNIADIKRQPTVQGHRNVNGPEPMRGLHGFPQPMRHQMEATTMPSVSQDQQIATAIAEHAPDKLYARNKGLLGMSHKQLHEFAATPRKSLPVSATKRHKVKYPQP